MKNFLKPLTMALALATTSGVMAQGLPSFASSLARRTADAYNVAIQMGDYGTALTDLSRLDHAARQFSYTLSPYDYQQLRYAHDVSRNSWNWLRAYSYDPNRFHWITYDLNEIGRYMNQPLPPPLPPRDRIISIVGNGSGGTSHGDRTAACQKAFERSYDDAIQQCSNQRGRILGAEQGSCSCSRKPGSSDDYTCRATTRASCEISGFFPGPRRR